MFPSLLISCGDNKLLLIATKSVGNYSSDFFSATQWHDTFSPINFPSRLLSHLFVCASKVNNIKYKMLFWKEKLPFFIMPVLCKSETQSQMFCLIFPTRKMFIQMFAFEFSREKDAEVHYLHKFHLIQQTEEFQLNLINFVALNQIEFKSFHCVYASCTYRPRRESWFY